MRFGLVVDWMELALFLPMRFSERKENINCHLQMTNESPPTHVDY